MQVAQDQGFGASIKLHNTKIGIPTLEDDIQKVRTIKLEQNKSFRDITRTRDIFSLSLFSHIYKDIFFFPYLLIRVFFLCMVSSQVHPRGSIFFHTNYFFSTIV